MSVLTRLLAAATAAALLTVGGATAAPAPGSGLAKARSHGVHGTTWTIHVKSQGSVFYYRPAGVKPGRYQASISGAFLGAGPGLNCGLLTSTDKTLLFGSSIPTGIGDPDPIVVVNASRTIRIPRGVKVVLACFYSGETSAIASLADFPLQLSLTAVDRVATGDGRVISPSKGAPKLLG